MRIKDMTDGRLIWEIESIDHADYISDEEHKLRDELWEEYVRRGLNGKPR